MKGTLGIIGLGLVASGKRNIRPGHEYESLYSKKHLQGTNPIVGGDYSDTFDTLNAMAKVVRESLDETEKVAKTLKGDSLEKTLKYIWNHVYNHFQYEKDATGIEQIRRPARSWVDRKSGIDCDCMSVLISSYLHHLKINHTFRKAEYNPATGWQHVYVVVPKQGVDIDNFKGYNKVNRDFYYVLDCVVDKFNYEVPFLKKFDKLMKIQVLNGIDTSTITGGVTPNLFNYRPETVGILSGFGREFDVLNSLNGTEGLSGLEIEKLFLNSLKQHLVNTRAVLALNPNLTEGIYHPATFRQRLDQLIAAFDNGTLGHTINHLASLEAKENNLSGLFDKVKSAVSSVAKTVASGVSSAAKSVATGVSNAAQAVASGAKTVAQNVASTAKPLVQAVGNKIEQGAQAVAKGVTVAANAVADAAKAAFKFVVRYNPATVAIRNGFLLAMKTNLFRQAEKIGYGLLTEQQATSAGLNVSEWKKAVEVLNKVRKIHKGIGGKIDKLDAAIKKGWEHGVSKHNLPKPGSSTSTAQTTPTKTATVVTAAANAVKTATVPSTSSLVSKGLTALKNALSGTDLSAVNASMPLLQMINEELKSLKFGQIFDTKSKTELEEFFQAVRTNSGGIATKLATAYKPVERAKLYPTDEYKKVLNVAQLAEREVLKRGGTAQQLKEAVSAGSKVLAKTGNLGEIVTTAAASAVIAAVAKLLSEVNWSTMFNGKASSPIESTSSGHISAEEDPDIFDEGDPTPVTGTVESLLSSIVGGGSTTSSVVKSAVQNLVSTAVTPTVTQAQELVKNVTAYTPEQAKQAVAVLPVEQLKQVVDKIQSSPVAEQLKNSPLVQEIQKVVPGIISPKTTNDSIQEAQVISSTINRPDSGNSMKYIAIVGASLAAIGIGYAVMSNKSKKSLGCLPEGNIGCPPPTENLGGIKRPKTKAKARKPKSSQKARKVMAIVI